MTGTRFNATKFANKMCSMGKDCIVLETEGLKKEIFKGENVYVAWKKETVYMRILKEEKPRFLEFVETSTDSWFKVTNKDTIRKIQREFAFQRC